jgi:penicillin amidase
LDIEKRSPDNKYEFLFNEKWEKAEVIDEPIKVKGNGIIDYEVTVTRHGPVISKFAADSGREPYFLCSNHRKNSKLS